MLQQQTGNAPLSVHWAFVVYFRVSSDVAHRQVAGRVEHVVSGQSTHFDSLEELLAFIERVLVTVRGPPSKGPSSRGPRQNPHDQTKKEKLL
jgi:hypothetical protein